MQKCARTFSCMTFETLNQWNVQRLLDGHRADIRSLSAETLWRFLHDRFDAMQEETCAVTYTAAGQVSQELCAVCLVDYERCVYKRTSLNHVTVSQIFCFAQRMLGPLIWTNWVERKVGCIWKVEGNIFICGFYFGNRKNSAGRGVCSLTFDTPEMISVLLFVGVFRAILDADSVSCRIAVSATGSRPLERRLLPGKNNKCGNQRSFRHIVKLTLVAWDDL